MTQNISKIKVPIIKNGVVSEVFLNEEMDNQRAILFGIPGAFTPTCSEKHFPGYLKLYNDFKNKKIENIFCLSVNDQYVMISWLSSYAEGNNIIGIADGNADITKSLNLISDKSKNYMGQRCSRFAMIIENNMILKTFIEEPGNLSVSSAEYILQEL